MHYDSDIDLNSLIAEANKQPTNTTSEPKISPLEKALQTQNTKGAVYTKEEIEKGSHTKPLTPPMSQERAKDINKWVNEQDTRILKMRYLKKIREVDPRDGSATMMAMEEIDALNIDDPENPHFVFHEDRLLDNSDPENPTWETIEDKNREPMYFAIKTKEEMNADENALKTKESNDSAEPVKSVNTQSSETSSNTNKEDEENAKKEKIIQVIIDKTGLGAEVHFTPEERQKITASEEIRVKEIQDVNLSSLNIKRVTDSFQNHIRKQEFSNSMVKISFPASGFSANMNGLTYGELGDISLSTEVIDVARYNKRLSVIYNKMSNISSGPFESYEDFLKHFAFTDIYMALYGLLITTFQENPSVRLFCNNDNCKKYYDWQYSTRGLLDLKACDQVFLDKMNELLHAGPADHKAIQEKAAVNNCKVIKLPHSGIIFEMGILSAYEYMYNFLPIASDEEFRNDVASRINAEVANDITIMSCIRKVYVPDEDGSYIEYDNYKDIFEVYFSIKPEECIILRSFMLKFITSYQAVFTIKNSECPHCKHVTPVIPVSIEELLFQMLQRLANTTVDVSNMLVL